MCYGKLISVPSQPVKRKTLRQTLFTRVPPKQLMCRRQSLSYLKAKARNGISLSEQASLSMKSSISATGTVKFLQNSMKCVRRSIGQCSLEAATELATKGWGSQGDGAISLQQWKVPGPYPTLLSSLYPAPILMLLPYSWPSPSPCILWKPNQ